MLWCRRFPGDDQALAQQVVVGAGCADREFRVRGNCRPAAAHRDVGIAERGLLDSLRGAFVEGRFMRQRQRLGRARFGGRVCRLSRRGLGRGRCRGLCYCRAGAVCAKAGLAAISVAMAAIAVFFIRSCPGKRRDGAEWQELREIGWRKREDERSRPAIVHESCVPIKCPRIFCAAAERDRPLAAFDMSLERLEWFATRHKNTGESP